MMKRVIRMTYCAVMFSAISSLLWQTEALAQAWTYGWPNEPAGSTLIRDWDMSGRDTTGFWQYYGGPEKFTPDATAPSGDGKILINHHYPNLASGTQSGVKYWGVINGSPRELFMGMVVKQSNPFAGYSNNANKTLWAVTATPKIASWNPIEFFGYQLSAYPVGFGIPYHPELLNDNGHIPGCHTNDSCWFRGTNQAWPVGVWHRVELYLKLGDSPTSKNGILRWWVDGVQIGNYTTVNFPGTYFIQVEWTSTWDGVMANPYDFEWAIDDIRISIPKGGSSTAPDSPTNVRMNPN